MTSQPREFPLVPALWTLLRQLEPARRRALLPLVGLMLLGALAELATLGALVPFLSFIADPDRTGAHPFVAPVLDWLGVRESAVMPVQIGLFAAAALSSAALRLTLLWATGTFVGGVARELSTRLYSDTLHQPYRFHTCRHTSEIIAIVNKTQIFSSEVLGPLMSGGAALVMACFIVTGLIIVDPVAALLAGGSFVAIYLAVTLFTRRRLSANGKIIARTQAERVKAMQDGLGGIRDVLLDQSQLVFVEGYDRAEARYRTARVWNTFMGGAPRFVVEAAGMIMIAAIAAAMTGRAGGIAAAIPVLGAMALGAQRLMPLVQQIYNAWAAAMGNKQVVLDVMELLERPRPRSPSVRRLPYASSIELRNVSFRYESNRALVLKDIDLRIEKGARIGIAGKTGGGKSTFVDIVLGLLEPSTGFVCVDGVALDADSRLAWQRNVAHVPQAIYLADASVAENIAFGVPPDRIDRERVRHAAEQAELGDVVAALPQGYDTPVGERGIQLSGGQRQRIGIARALYKDASVLVFDEATSALDAETEAAVMSAIGKLDRQLTIIIIAHRLSTLDQCDRVVQLERGSITAIETRRPANIGGAVS